MDWWRYENNNSKGRNALREACDTTIQSGPYKLGLWCIWNTLWLVHGQFQNLQGRNGLNHYPRLVTAFASCFARSSPCWQSISSCLWLLWLISSFLRAPQCGRADVLPHQPNPIHQWWWCSSASSASLLCIPKWQPDQVPTWWWQETAHAPGRH